MSEEISRGGDELLQEFYREFRNHASSEEVLLQRTGELISKINEKENKWHLGKEFPITLVATLILQTFGAIWWASSLSAKVDTLQEKIADIASKQYTNLEAKGSSDLLALRISELDRRLVQNEHNVREIDILLRAKGIDSSPPPTNRVITR